MATIVTPASFVGDINIPNTNNQTVLDRLTAFIVRYEAEFLRKTLGYPLYKVFGTESSTRMTELLEGAEYQSADDDLTMWDGIHDPIARYIFYHWLSANAIQLTGTGTTTPKTDAQNNVSPEDKMITCWNDMSEMVMNMVAFLWLQEDYLSNRIYPEFSSDQFLFVQDNFRTINLFGF